MSYRSVFTSHTSLNLSGVAKFNAILARRLDSENRPLADLPATTEGPVLLSLKVVEVSSDEQAELVRFAQRARRDGLEYDLFLHNYHALAAEQVLLDGCRHTFCGNDEIAHAIRGSGTSRSTAWCPRLVDDDATITASPFTLFSFGMAHKIRVDEYQRLADVLEHLNVDYTIRVSTAFHEKANFGDFDSIATQMREIFPDRIEFLGFLSDAAVNYFVAQCQLFVAFFEKGVRANNTSLYAAMARGTAVLANFDEHSPPWMKHGDNVLDLAALQPEDLYLDRLRGIGRRGAEHVREYTSWDALEQFIRETAKQDTAKQNTPKQRTAKPSGSRARS